uniref:Uncharacterized protein n=1 Tax=Glossina pallidipes TaxID=7398 RepID=A0A1B0AAJ8_GLOPL
MYTTYTMFGNEVAEEDDSLQQINEDHNTKDKSTNGDIGREEFLKRCNKEPVHCGCRPHYGSILTDKISLISFGEINESILNVNTLNGISVTIRFQRSEQLEDTI